MKQFFNRFLATTVVATSLLAPSVVKAADVVYYSTDFNTSSLASIGFTALDANADGVTWTPTTTKATFRNLDGVAITAVEKTPVTLSNATHDDWLISPSIRFEAGKTYKVTILMGKYNYAAVEDAFEVKLGTAKTAESMTATLIPLTDGDMPQYGGNSLWTKTFDVLVEQTGDYYIGIHAVGKPGQRLAVAEMSVAAGVAMVTPAAIADLTLSPDPMGDKKVAISFTAPAKAKDGSDLTALSKIEIRRNGDLAHQVDNPVPGQKYTVEDLVAVNALYTYSAVAFTDAGGGDKASATTFVGINVPAPAVGVKAVNTGNRTARVSWGVPALDKDGYPIAASNIKYDVIRKRIYTNFSTVIAKDISELSLDDELPLDSVTAENPQAFYSYSVVAKTVEGNASAATFDYVPLGQPYASPYFESFPRSHATHIFTSTPLTQYTGYWSKTTDFEDVSSVDADNGMIYLNGAIGSASSAHTGLIDLSTIPSPALSYYTYNIIGCDPADHELQVVVTATDGTVKEFDRYVPAEGWTKVILRLDEFAGKTIRINFNGYRKNNTSLMLDAIAISNIYPADLKVASIAVPEKVRTGEAFDVTVKVLNFGSDISGDYSVELYCDNECVDTYNATALPVGAYDKVVFSCTHTITDPEKASYSARIICEGDADNTNNLSDTVSTTIRRNAYPTVADLSGMYNGSSVLLSWSEPDTEKAQPYEITDDFEAYTSWATSDVGEWVFVDLDHAQVSGFIEGVMPGIPNYSEQSWWIFDNSHPDFNNGSFNTISGCKFLASMVSGIKGQGYVQNDDWAISPLLYGGPQTITVNARSYDISETGFESFEVYYSTGSTNPADFVKVGEKIAIPSEYAPYEFDLPDSARRFAIRNISLGKYVLMVDDVTYIPTGKPGAFSINGYNVYRDGVKINIDPVEENEFEDLTAPEGDHSYNVSVLYSSGESQFSNTWLTGSSALSTIVPANNHDEYYTLQGIRVTKPQPGQIYILRRGPLTAKILMK